MDCQRPLQQTDIRTLRRNPTGFHTQSRRHRILDNVAFHKSKRAEELVRQRGAWLLFLPPYSPDLNPIELAYSKLKTLLRKQAARDFDAICDAVGDICNLYTANQCLNFFKTAGYEAD